MAKKRRTKGGRRSRSKATAKAHTPLRWYWRYSVMLALAGVAALLWMSLLTYNPDDLAAGSADAGAVGRTASGPDNAAPSWETAPASAPAGREVSNAVGIVGAHMAGTLLHTVGGGVYAAVLLATLAALAVAFWGRVATLALRVVGAVLLVAVISSALYLLYPSQIDADSVGPAGVLGVWVGQFLEGQFALSGAWTIVIVAFAIALGLTAGRLVITVPARLIKWWIAWRQAAAERRAARRKEAEQQAAARLAEAASAEPGETVAEMESSESTLADQATQAAESRDELLAEIRREIDARKPQAASETKQEPQHSVLPGEPAADPEWASHELPSTDLLVEPAPRQQGAATDAVEDPGQQQSTTLERALTEFGISASVVGCEEGPSLRMFELALSPGVKVAEVTNLTEDLARSLSVGGVRVVSPLPGRDTIGLEVPRSDRGAVCLRELMDACREQADKMALPMYLGRDAVGSPILADLAAMPHMLIAGTTGSGKSVCMNTIILGLALMRRPTQVRLVLVDPKMVEMAAFENIPHLLCPIISDMGQAGDVLGWAAARMDDRYRLLKRVRVRNIADFNRLDQAELRKRLDLPEDAEGNQTPIALPYVVVIVDELADLMMTAGKDVQSHIVRIAQKARAVGIHLVLATQRPSADVVTGLIKSNVACRVSFQVASKL